MASRPFYESKKKRWVMKWWAGVARGWVKQTLGPHPPEAPLRKTPPKSIQLIARRYEDRETQARHGVNVAPARAHDLGEYLAAYQTVFDATHANDSGQNLRYAIKSFLPFCEGRGVRTVEAVTPSVCRDWMEAQVHKIERITIKTRKGYLSPIWSRALMDEIVARNPWYRLPIPGKPNDVEPSYWTLEELHKLMGATSGWLRDLIILGVNTGLRISALLGLEWRDVDFERGHLVVRKELSKSGKKYYVPINASANEVLFRRTATKKPPGVYVMPGVVTNTVISYGTTYRMLKRAAKKAGLADKGHWNHAMRHTFASHAAMRGIPLAVISGWLGHSSLQLVNVYAHLIPADSNSRMASFDLAPPRID